jgi:hypothetical protein
MANTYHIQRLGSSTQFIRIDEYNEQEDLIRIIVLMNPSLVLEPTPEDTVGSFRITTANKQYDIPIVGLNLFGNTNLPTAKEAIAYFYNSYE